MYTFSMVYLLFVSCEITESIKSKPNGVPDLVAREEKQSLVI